MAFHYLLVKQLLYHNRIKPSPLLPYHHYPDNNLPPALLKNQIVNYPNSFYHVPESIVKHNQHIPFLEVFPIVVFDLKAIMHYQDMFPYTSLPYQKFQMHLLFFISYQQKDCLFIAFRTEFSFLTTKDTNM